MQKVISGSIAKLMYDPSKKIFSLNDESAVINPGVLAKDAAMGSTVGAILGGGQIANLYNGEVEGNIPETVFDKELSHEQERMSSSGEYAVKKDMTSSGDFVRRFNAMTADLQTRREFYSESKRMLHRRSGTNGEDLIFYNPRLRKWYRSTNGTEAGQPDYNDEIKLGLKENKNNELIAFHNHPLGMPPSVEDLNAALRNGYAKGYTIGHNGRIFEYTAPQECIPESVYNNRVLRYLEKGKCEFEAQCAALNDLSKLYGFVFSEVK